MVDENNEKIEETVEDLELDEEGFDKEARKKELDERVALLAPSAEQAVLRIEETNKRSVKNVKASLELIREKRKRLHKLEVPVFTETITEIKVDEDGNEYEENHEEVTVMDFMVKRPTDKVRLESLKYSSEQLNDLSVEKRAEIDKDFYVYVSKLIVEPKMSPEEVETELDQATLKYISQRIVMLSVQPDDGKLLDFFRVR
jgi:hypothetical protein